MKKRDTFRMLFYIRKNRLKADGKASINLRITLNCESITLAVHRSVTPEDWVTDVGQAKTTSKELKQRMYMYFRYPTINHNWHIQLYRDNIARRVDWSWMEE